MIGQARASSRMFSHSWIRPRRTSDGYSWAMKSPRVPLSDSQRARNQTRASDLRSSSPTWCPRRQACVLLRVWQVSPSAGDDHELIKRIAANVPRVVPLCSDRVNSFALIPAARIECPIQSGQA